MLKSTGNEPEAIPFYARLIAEARDGFAPLKTAVIYPVNGNTLKGAVRCAQEKFLDIVLVGPRRLMEEIAAEESLDISPYEIVEAARGDEAVQTGVQMAAAGKVQALMKGHIHTDELMRVVMQKESGLRTARRMSHVFVVDVPLAHYPKPLFLSDAAINIRPTLEQKRDIVQNAIDLFRACNGEAVPKVAILSATEQINSDIPSTIDAAALAKMADRGNITGGIVDGPLAFDNAVSAESAAIKGIKSPVAGDVDILIVPDLESGNMLYKQMKFLSGYNAAGIVMGACVPIILTSRAGEDQARLASAALALLYVKARDEGRL